MKDNIHIDVYCSQKNFGEERICGDVFISRKVEEEDRTIIVLSDGMGHGVKANVLATLSSTMALNFTSEHKEAEKIAEIIMNTLPVCSERKMSYSTFSIVDINHDGRVNIIEYDNPQTTILRRNVEFDPGWNCIILQSPKNSGKEIKTCSFYPQKEDRIILCSDGVSQAGMGSDAHPFGWGIQEVRNYAIRLIESNPIMSARRISQKIVAAAHKADGYNSKDDTSCAIVYFREPRKLLVCTGPPYEKENDKLLANAVKNFDGRIVLCGATTADIISRELDIEIVDSLTFDDPELPPMSKMEGIDLVTEGILTLTKVTRLLKDYSSSYDPGKGPADRIFELFKKSDEIHFIIGTRINIAHQDPNLPVDLEIRRTVVKRMAKLLETKFLKTVRIEYI
ncbi:MAG: serine/threonine-protein phosphatase [Bacteroidales bacterium]|nr:serine/threonine-protein phosphatase [Bacteroidales bacterium]